MTSTTTQRGGVTAQQATLTAKIQSVDLKKNTVLIRGPQGKTHTLKVDDPDLQAKLRQIKPGDTVDITYTQAVAVAVAVEPSKP
jgi:lipopolysaccharide export system protein LptC